MQIAMIELGRMGGSMARRLMADGHKCVVYDRDLEQVERLVAEGAAGASDMAKLARLLAPSRTARVMVPAADALLTIVARGARQKRARREAGRGVERRNHRCHLQYAPLQMNVC